MLMRMDTQPENFENLRRLLVLKRHEKPPPGYFDGLSREVFLRLQAGESDQQAGWERPEWEAPWLQRLWEALSLKPFLTGAMGVAACGMVLAGILFAEAPDSAVFANNGAPNGAPPPSPLMAMPASTPGIAFNQSLLLPEPVAATNVTTSLQPTIPSGLFGGDINPELVKGRPLLGN
jgi:hypothetical protein